MVRVTGLLLSLSTLGSAGAVGQVRAAQPVGQPDSVAGRAGIAVFTRLITKDNYRDMGFTSESEIRSATLGAQLPEYLIRLDELRGFQAGQDPGALLHASGRVTWLVLVGGQVRSSLTLSLGDRGWEPVAYGSPQHARILDSVYTQLVARPGGGGTQYVEVRVPALNTAFIGHRQGGQLFLTPILSDQRFNFESGVTLPASQALLQMVSAARQHNGLPT